MEKNEIRTSIKTVYGMLWDVLSLYEKTECYNRVPKELGEGDIWEFMGGKLQEVRKEVSKLFLGEEEIRTKLFQIVDEVEHFVRIYERPGVVIRWKQINPRIIFWDCSFDIKKGCPQEYRKVSWGLSNLKFSCYPDESLEEARKRYFEETEKKIKEHNLRYSEERVFQDELQRTLTLVFEQDFKDYL